MRMLPAVFQTTTDVSHPEPAQSDLRMSLDRGVQEWLDVMKHRTGSTKTEKAYTEGMTEFRQALQQIGLDLDSDPATIAPLARRWCAFSRVGRDVSAATFNQRRAILSSFYKYAIQNRVQGITCNPLETIETRKGAKKASRPLPFADVMKALQAIDTQTLEGKRDKAILIVSLMSGHRVSEIAGMRTGHITFEDEQATIFFPRCKGNKEAVKPLKPSTSRVLKTYLDALFPGGYTRADPSTPVWQNMSLTTPQLNGEALSVRTLERICERKLGTSKFHALRHTAAVLMVKSGATLPEIAKFLGHQNLKTTSDYLNELLGDENVYGEKMEAFLGIE